MFVMQFIPLYHPVPKYRRNKKMNRKDSKKDSFAEWRLTPIDCCMEKQHFFLNLNERRSLKALKHLLQTV